MAGQKFLEGKFCYEKVPNGSSQMLDCPCKKFASRQFKIQDGTVYLAPGQDEEALLEVMPIVGFQEMY